MIFERFKIWLASFNAVNGIPLPDEGRSSVESAAGALGALGALGTVSPIVDFKMLALLKQLWILNPDLSQYVSNLVNLGNTGHQVVVDAATSARAEAAAARLNEAAPRLYPNGAGIDGLLNQYFAQIAVLGAASSEDVVDFPGRRVKKVVIVPVEQIRFRYIEDEFVPHQQPNNLMGTARSASARSPFGLIPLNPETYHYYALETIENSPYAKPPASAAVAPITGPQADMVENIKYIAQKFGLLGLITLMCSPPSRKPSESENEYQSRAKKYLSSVRTAIEPNFRKGLLVTFRDQKIEHTAVSSDARGAREVWQINEEQVMSGLKMQPAFFGRTDSTTETYANVVYNLLLAQVGNIQRLVKRRQEATYRLDLRLGGIEVDGVSIVFNRAHARDPLKEAQAEQIHFQTAKEKADCGMISPDEAAQECGYESAFDPELMSSHPDVANSLQRMKVGAGRAREAMTATFRFDRYAQRYKFIPRRIELANSEVVEADSNVNVIQLKKKAA